MEFKIFEVLEEEVFNLESGVSVKVSLKQDVDSNDFIIGRTYKNRINSLEYEREDIKYEYVGAAQQYDKEIKFIKDIMVDMI